MPSGLLRTFLAVPVTMNTLMTEAFTEWKNSFPRSKIRWVHPGNVHLTLTFLGETSPDQVEGVAKYLEAALKGTQLFGIHIRTMGLFGGIREPRVFWMGVDDNASRMQALKQITDAAANRQGIDTDPRPFRPHLTLGRPRNIREHDGLKELLEKYRDTLFGEIPVKEVVFFESRPGSEGPLYSAICRFPLEQP